MSAPPLETKGGGLAKDMTLRDWYIGQLMPGALCRTYYDDVHPLMFGEHIKAAAEYAGQCADALLIERERGE